METYSINDFQEGEIVFLKTDLSQSMVISNIDKNNNVIRCYWRDKKKNISVNEVYPPTVLCKESDIPPKMGMRIHAI